MNLAKGFISAIPFNVCNRVNMELGLLLLTYKESRLSLVKQLANVTQLVSDRDGTSIKVS